MKDRDKILLGIGLGLLAGGVAGYYLASEDGQRMQKNAKKKLKKLNTDVQETIKEQSEVINSKLNEIVESTKNWVSEVSDTVKEKVSKTGESAEGIVDDVKSSFKKGAEKARNNLRETEKTVEK